MKKILRLTSHLYDGLEGIGFLAKRVASGMVYKYERQLPHLSRKGVEKLGESAVKIMIKQALSHGKGLERPEDAPAFLLKLVSFSHGKAGTLKNTPIQTIIKGKPRWTAEGVLQRTGIETKKGKFYVARTRKLNKALKYGCRREEDEFAIDPQQYEHLPLTTMPPLIYEHLTKEESDEEKEEQQETAGAFTKSVAKDSTTEALQDIAGNTKVIEGARRAIKIGADIIAETDLNL